MIEDELGGTGSLQSTNIPGEIERDVPFWRAATKNIKNMHALVSGHSRSFFRRHAGYGEVTYLNLDHGNEWCKRNFETDIVLCFNKHTGYVFCSSSLREHVFTREIDTEAMGSASGGTGRGYLSSIWTTSLVL